MFMLSHDVAIDDSFDRKKARNGICWLCWLLQ